MMFERYSVRHLLILTSWGRYPITPMGEGRLMRRQVSNFCLKQMVSVEHRWSTCRLATHQRQAMFMIRARIRLRRKVLVAFSSTALTVNYCCLLPRIASISRSFPLASTFFGWVMGLLLDR